MNHHLLYKVHPQLLDKKLGWAGYLVWDDLIQDID